jgi:hypothetical protein
MGRAKVTPCSPDNLLPQCSSVAGTGTGATGLGSSCDHVSNVGLGGASGFASARCGDDAGKQCLPPPPCVSRRSCCGAEAPSHTLVSLLLILFDRHQMPAFAPPWRICSSFAHLDFTSNSCAIRPGNLTSTFTSFLSSSLPRPDSSLSQLFFILIERVRVFVVLFWRY